MVTTLNSAGTGTRDGTYAVNLGVVHKNFTFRDTAAGVEKVIGVLPAGAIMSSGTLWVRQIFDGTTPTISIGVAGTPALYLAATATTAVGGTSLGALLIAAAAVPTNAPRNIVAVVGGTGVQTTGSADVVLAFTP